MKRWDTRWAPNEMAPDERLDTGEIAERAAAEHYVARICFKTGPPTLHRRRTRMDRPPHRRPDPPPRPASCARALDPHAPPTLDPAAATCRCRTAAVLTVEPGGQVEISTPPTPPWPTLHAATTADIAHLTDLLARAGLRLGDSGIDPHRPPRRLLRHPALRRDGRRFDRRGPARPHHDVQHRRRCRSASTPGSPARVAARWAAVHALGPAAARRVRQLAAGTPAAAPAGPRPGCGRGCGMDPPRTGPAAAARRPGRRTGRGTRCAAACCACAATTAGGTPPPGVDLRRLDRRRAAVRPTYADLDYHLTTLFPPVRPRGYLEVRYLDQQPRREWHAPVAVLAALLADGRHVDAARDLAAPVGRAAGSRPPGTGWPTRRSPRRHGGPARPGRAAGCRRTGLPARRSRRGDRGGRPPAGRGAPSGAVRARPRRADDLSRTACATGRGELDRSPGRTTVLTDAVDDDDLVRQHSPLMSPLVWDLAHVGNQEELWLVRDVGGREPVRERHRRPLRRVPAARADRPALPLLGPAEARAYVGDRPGQGARRARPSPAGRHGRCVDRRVRVRHDRAARAAARRDDAGHPPAARRRRRCSPAPPPPAAPAPVGRRGAGPGRPVHHGHLDRAVGAGQRAARARGRRAGVRHRRRRR